MRNVFYFSNKDGDLKVLGSVTGKGYTEIKFESAADVNKYREKVIDILDNNSVEYGIQNFVSDKELWNRLHKDIIKAKDSILNKGDRFKAEKFKIDDINNVAYYQFETLYLLAKEFSDSEEFILEASEEDAPYLNTLLSGVAVMLASVVAGTTFFGKSMPNNSLDALSDFMNDPFTDSDVFKSYDADRYSIIVSPFGNNRKSKERIKNQIIRFIDSLPDEDLGIKIIENKSQKPKTNIEAFKESDSFKK